MADFFVCFRTCLHVYIGDTSAALIMKAHYDPEIKAKALLRPPPFSLVGGGVAWAPMDSHDVCWNFRNFAKKEHRRVPFLQVNNEDRIPLLTGKCLTPTQLLICSSFSRENGHLLLICSSLSTSQLNCAHFDSQQVLGQKPRITAKMQRFMMKHMVEGTLVQNTLGCPPSQ